MNPLSSVPAARRQTEDLVRAVALTTMFGERTVLDGVDLAVRRGEVFVIMGPSGCGKTTLLRNLCGLLPPTLGSVSVAGHDLYSASPELLQHLRLRTGLSFQGGALLGNLSVLENVALPLRENTDLDDELIVEIARMKLDMVGLLHAAASPPSALSGGMRKRAALARAIALDPEILFCDEPTAGLDPVTAAGIDRLIVDLRDGLGITVVVVSHELNSIRRTADQVTMLQEGVVMAEGTIQSLEQSPDPRISGFFRGTGTPAQRVPADLFID